MGDVATPPNADAVGMEAAHHFMRAEEVESRHIERDGSPVAVLRSIDMGGRFTVVVETFPRTGDTTAGRMRPYAFADSESARAFLDETVSSFTLLGCDIRTA
jgi:hypothetical protein